jgi:hypothetical protein
MIETEPVQTGVTVIAPVPPFRGGIARHSLALCNALVARSDVRLSIESFDRLYPQFLYPGDSDRSTDVALPLMMQAAYNLDTVNPLAWRSVADAIVRRGDTIAVLPAWTFFTAPVLGYLARRLRRNGLHTVMVVHNAHDHEAAGWKNKLLAWQIAAADRTGGGFGDHRTDDAEHHNCPSTIQRFSCSKGQLASRICAGVTHVWIGPSL